MHPEPHDSAFYRTIIEHLVDDCPWDSINGDVRPSRVAATAADPTAVAELQLTHLLTDAELYCQLPGPGDGSAAHLVLYQGLDHALDGTGEPSDDGFVETLSAAHETIASVHESEYVTPVADPTIILEAHVPHSYTESKLYSMMTAISATALRVQRLHGELRTTVNAVSNVESDGGHRRSPLVFESSVESACQR
ncbi:hypothetical protein [Natronorubrum tibetense]|uniref:Uncharacterized protein n=1 Tax=Natronorubrum tibetense GA33 TaxID=1114856 RepID=L9VF32_9EURY|nr:hypothetical protein [Natronorubrum tibetense]ELY35557.1 hypothetical protein C496_23311 [Natronorubrum tibetense GA33]